MGNWFREVAKCTNSECGNYVKYYRVTENTTCSVCSTTMKTKELKPIAYWLIALSRFFSLVSLFWQTIREFKLVSTKGKVDYEREKAELEKLLSKAKEDATSEHIDELENKKKVLILKIQLAELRFQQMLSVGKIFTIPVVLFVIFFIGYSMYDAFQEVDKTPGPEQIIENEEILANCQLDTDYLLVNPVHYKREELKKYAHAKPFLNNSPGNLEIDIAYYFARDVVKKGEFVEFLQSQNQQQLKKLGLTLLYNRFVNQGSVDKNEFLESQHQWAEAYVQWKNAKTTCVFELATFEQWVAATLTDSKLLKTRNKQFYEWGNKPCKKLEHYFINGNDKDFADDPDTQCVPNVSEDVYIRLVAKASGVQTNATY